MTQSDSVELARSLVNRAHNAIGSGKYDRATVRGWLAQADAALSKADAGEPPKTPGGKMGAKARRPPHRPDRTP